MEVSYFLAAAILSGCGLVSCTATSSVRQIPPRTYAKASEDVENAILSGIEQATMDLAQGKLILYHPGGPPPIDDSPRDRVLKRYGVEERPDTDVFSWSIEGRRSAYNAIMANAIDQKFGGGFWSRVKQETAAEEAKNK